MRAEAYQEEGPNRHINSAFMIFEALDDNGKPRALPRLRPEPLVSHSSEQHKQQVAAGVKEQM